MNLVVFHGHGCHWMDPLLKEGFKHCFAVVDNAGYMICVDGKAGKPDVEVVCGSDYDLKGFYVKQGFTVVEVGGGLPTICPLTLSNCVGMVKSVLGIRAFLAITPYQLYRRLTR